MNIHKIRQEEYYYFYRGWNCDAYLITSSLTLVLFFCRNKIAHLKNVENVARGHKVKHKITCQKGRGVLHWGDPRAPRNR